ncbi:PilW family protein [Spongiibacter marinus]|uniref:PilW family protein n=1 Tax=Spongiibacter marinus TaxID=354246 RepID=UPI0035BE6C78
MNAQRGFGLIELMIAITLGLILSTAIIQVFLASRTSYQLQESLSMIQENARFGMHFMGREVRMAGYMGCNSVGNIDVNVIAKPATYAADFVPVKGEDDVGAGHNLGAVEGTDTIQILRGGDGSVRLTGNLAPNNANVQIEDNTYNIAKGDYVLISDCTSADIFRVTNTPKESGKGTATLTHGNGSNTSNRLSKIYGGDAEVFGFEVTHFFVRDTGRDTAGGRPVLSLYSQQRATGSGGSMAAAVELVEGVENLQIVYGLDTDNDRAIDSYADASAVTDWQQVVSAKLELTLVANDEGVVGRTGSVDAQSVYDSSGQLLSNTDGRMRQVFSSVFAIRNRLP